MFNSLLLPLAFLKLYDQTYFLFSNSNFLFFCIWFSSHWNAEQLKYLANIVICFVFCYLSFLTRSWYWLNEKLCGFLYCPWFNVMSLLSWNNWIGCNSIQQPWSNLSDSDAWAKAFYRLIESSMAGWCDSLVERQNLGERNIYCMSPLQPLGDSSALKTSNE